MRRCAFPQLVSVRKHAACNACARNACARCRTEGLAAGPSRVAAGVGQARRRACTKGIVHELCHLKLPECGARVNKKPGSDAVLKSLE